MKIVRDNGWNFDMSAAPKDKMVLCFHKAEYRRGQLYHSETVRVGYVSEWPNRPTTAWKPIDLTKPVLDYADAKR